MAPFDKCSAGRFRRPDGTLDGRSLLSSTWEEQGDRRGYFVAKKKNEE